MNSACRQIVQSACGAALLDTMVAALLLSVVMASAYSNLITQMRAHAGQMMMTDTMNQVRVGSSLIADQISMAGFGVPSASTPSIAPKLVTATSSQLSFWTSLNAQHTYLTAAAATGDTSLQLLSANGLKAGTSIYITDWSVWYKGTVQSVSGTTLTVSPSLTYAFGAGSQLTPVQQVSFQLVGSDLQRNGHTIMNDVTGLTFTYDSPTLSSIREVTITLSAQTRAVDRFTGRKLSFSVTTTVTPADLAL